MPIHPTAIIDRSAEVDPSADIGAYAVIEAGCQIGPDVRLFHHAYVAEGTRLHRGVEVHPFAVIGHRPQDLKWHGEPTYTEVGERTILREHVTVHRGTIPESTTRIGRECFLMATAHVAHNCTVGDNVIMANGVLLGGHVQIGARSFIGGYGAAHQFVRVGDVVMIAGVTALLQDVPPFMTVGHGARITGPNTVGLRRAGFSSDERLEIRQVHRLLYRSGLGWPAAVARVKELVSTDAGRRIVAFLQEPSRRGYASGGRRHGHDEGDAS